MTTLIAEAELPLTWQDCLDYLGPEAKEFFMRCYLHDHQRRGQAWMNALFYPYPEDYRKLAGTLYDPFYRDSRGDVIRALMFLLEN